ncbi:uncharacterized protein [Phaseolus vulgaris]|uniref:uncharacterized protein isoform X2 n=1 Tax=Phaseolus vulgaris TaxID=3885 RepID=UPI0035CB6040
MEALKSCYGDGSSDSDSESVPSAPTSAPSAVFTPLPPPPISLLEPSTFIDLQIGQSTRVRSFPHVDGNYALHVYIPKSMVQERSAAVSALEIEVLPLTRIDKGSAGPSQKSKKRPRDDGNTATTTRSPRSLPTPPPHREVVEVALPSSRHVERAAGPSEAGAGASPSPFDFLGGGLQFTQRVHVALPNETRESIRGVSPSDLLRSGLELMCRSIVLFQNGIQGRDRQADDVSQLEHQLAEATEDLKQSLAANNELLARIAREAAKRELAQKDAAEARQRLAAREAETLRAAIEIAELKKMVEETDEKLSSSATELAALQAAKDQVEAELDQNYEESEELLKQCFDRAVRQAHVLYGGPPATGEFNIDCEVHQGRLVPSAEMGALAAEEVGPIEVEEGECIEVQD